MIKSNAVTVNVIEFISHHIKEMLQYSLNRYVYIYILPNRY